MLLPVVVVAGDGGITVQPALEIGADSLLHRALCTGDHLDTHIVQSIDRAGANAAADRRVNPELLQKTRQRAVAIAHGRLNLLIDDGVVLHGKQRKLRRLAKVLEHLSVKAWYCYNHAILILSLAKHRGLLSLF